MYIYILLYIYNHLLFPEFLIIKSVHEGTFDWNSMINAFSGFAETSVTALLSLHREWASAPATRGRTGWQHLHLQHF